MCSNKWNNCRRACHVPVADVDLATLNRRTRRVANPVQTNIPAFDPTSTIAANRVFFKNHIKANAEALQADNALHRQHNKQIRKLRSYKRKTAATQQDKLLASINRSDVDGLAAAKQLTAAQAPAQIHNHTSIENKCRQYGHNPIAHGLVKANIYANSTMMTVVDLRDDAKRSLNGNTIRRGAIYEPETGLNATKVNLQLYVEVAGNRKRAIEQFHIIARDCPEIKTLHVEVIGEDNILPARVVMQALQDELANNTSGFAADIQVDFSVSRYDSEDN